VDADVGDGVEAARAACERLGATVVERSAPRDLPMSDMTTVLLTEMWVLHSGYSDRADHYRPAIRELVDAASNATDAIAYIHAQKRRANFTAEWEQWFTDQGVDVLLEPTVPTVAHVRGRGTSPATRAVKRILLSRLPLPGI
jgi:Asp-tRNA(Asn)/Glu-tRNA(Gln) amidotransferase A subunit family amidase